MERRPSRRSEDPSHAVENAGVLHATQPRSKFPKIWGIDSNWINAIGGDDGMMLAGL